MRSAIIAASLLAGSAAAAERDIQFARFDIPGRVIEVHNFGTSAVDLSGWRTCSHSGTQIRRYSGQGGLNSVVIQPGTSLFIHLLNDAPARPNAINATTMGGQFANLTAGPYGLSIYFPTAGGNVTFPDGNFIADHVQWSVNGVDDVTADERSDEAVAGGVWTAETDWVSIAADTKWVILTDLSGGVLHGPANYQTLRCVADFNPDGNLDFFDVAEFLGAFSSTQPRADINFDGVHDFFDVAAYLGLFSAGCP